MAFWDRLRLYIILYPEESIKWILTDLSRDISLGEINQANMIQISMGKLFDK